MKRCDICLEETCGGRKNCNCDTCKQIKSCPRYLSPTIRITTKCTQECSHCCYSCSPYRTDFMSIEVAHQIASFITNNGVIYCTLMGGEFFCHPKWRTIFNIIIPTVKVCRLVTNGDWGQKEYVAKFLSTYNTKLLISISEDGWHSNKYVRQAKELCDEYDLIWNVPSNEMKSDNVLVPVGRSKYTTFSLFAMFSSYCSDPSKKYSFLIDEAGVIYKCGFGVWDYARVQDYVRGDFADRFKIFNKKFYSVFIPNCIRCSESYLRQK